MVEVLDCKTDSASLDDVVHCIDTASSLLQY